ncbi:hypothetical protein SAMN05428988_3240 [Chitinophaga sp. YR573]|uniref:hypothetical protein n=1 Tax=Chitinophaga sp. YR573 TaxID=1881040 RepID=UPI0008B0BC58|nr:hypothetical protein [Chitinophaga sp. YR573]SEW21711.1 hypothetical protein SAMN05428988_3240 [Chitinophaga sp. YR573]
MDDVVVNNRSLKGLQSHLHSLNGERDIILFKINGLNQQLGEVNNNINKTEKMLRLMKRNNVIVSEHAILRFIERVQPLPPSEVAARILTPSLKNMVLTLGNGTYPVDDFLVKVRDNIVVTVIKRNK